MKKKVFSIVVVCIVAVAIISAFFNIRKANYNYGREQGYLIGYCIGHADKANGEEQNSQELAGNIVPFEFGNAKWKGFMIGFADGYSDGFTGMDNK